MTHEQSSQLTTSQESKHLFLLGGHDLEMMEIKRLLEEQGYTYVDLGLQWGAKWRDYQYYYNDERQLVGVELSRKEDKPSGAIDIDHHNERAGEPASIEQVAELLGMNLTRRQKLIAANDYGYIPAMKAMGATDEEISEIRRLDRQAQGVTNEDERLAEESIKSLDYLKGVAVVYSQTEHFSPITDRLQEDRLLVYTDDELSYFGKLAGKVTRKFQNWINSGNAYSGGGENGFFGIVPGAVTIEEIEQQLIPQIIAIVGDEQ